MKKQDDYISGPHRFWIHFWCGLVLGGGISLWCSWRLFDSTAAILSIAGVSALFIAYCCGRWGDSAWHWLIERLPWIR